jgi:putative Ca2+/H+ antiporter (TMEM165/GDT1 family)
LEAFLISTGLVALAEVGDKTQLLSLVLAARFRKPWPIIVGILIATAANHALAAGVGAWVTTLASAEALRWALGLSFIAMAAWMLLPDKLQLGSDERQRFGALGTTIIAFFIVEMGDKTQVATVALAAKYATYFAVLAGTTAGMMIANVPAVLLGDRLAGRLPVRLVHGIAAVIFAALGVLVLFSA